MSFPASVVIGLIFGALAGACAFVIAYAEYKRNWAFHGNAVHASLRTAAVTFVFFFLAALLLPWLFSVVAGAAPQTNPAVVFETELGTIEMEVDVAHAPVTGANFLKYVDGKFYDGGVINRAVRPDNTVRHDVEIQVVQFQIDPSRTREQFPPIALERTNATGLKHVDGAVSMARGGPDTATASFFVTIGDQPSLDFGGARNADGQGFAAFGRVIAGKDVVRKIQAAPTGTTGAYGTETLAPPIKILRARRRPPRP